MTTITRLFVAKWCLIFLASAPGWAATACAAPAPPQMFHEGASAQPADIEVFVREGCPHCARAEAFLAPLIQEQPELRIMIRDVLKEPAALERLTRIVKDRGGTLVRVPSFAVGSQLIVGFSDEAATDQLIRTTLAQTRAQRLKSPEEPPIPAAGTETFAVNFFGRSVSRRIDLREIAGNPLK
ncbi:MAG: hypothetical protein A3J49_10070 [Gallionellales bacterium RIFCSPHIGHO2_02_FULL_57_16]|nr:MAG: hypothetical protein A3J49_10070 [Gallionellales bacterium RIFCSPHIGHO2_02_FULL_57_16]